MSLIQNTLMPPYNSQKISAIGIFISLLIFTVFFGFISLRHILLLSSVRANSEQKNQDRNVYLASNEILVKIKSSDKSKIRDKLLPDDTGINSLNKANKDLKVAKIEKVIKTKEKLSNNNQSIFRWYKITLPGSREIISASSRVNIKQALNEFDNDNLNDSANLIELKKVLRKFKEVAEIEEFDFNYLVSSEQLSTPSPSATPSAVIALPSPDASASAQVLPENIPNDPYYHSNSSWGQPYDDLWGLKKIKTEEAWKLTTGSEAITVAVIDSGIDFIHPDILQNIWINSREIPDNNLDDDGNGFADDVRGWNFFANSKDSFDDNGHGTHVAGTIGAVGNNGIGVVGVNWKAKLMPVKFLNSSGAGYEDDGANAIIYAADNGAKVINNSWGGSGKSALIGDAVNYAHDVKGAVVIAAAGNDNADAIGHSPANEPNVITVSSTDHEDKKSDFSNWGVKIDVAAPGGDSVNSSANKDYRNVLSLRAKDKDIYGDGTSIVGSDFYRARGTSMAAPHVSGLAALILAQRPNLGNEEVRAILRASADDADVAGVDINTGAGRINAQKALSVNSVLQVDITSPLDLANFTNETSLQVTGTASGSGFSSFQLSYSQSTGSSLQWNQVSSSNTPVANGVLGTIDLTKLSTGKYIIKLSATDQNGLIFYKLLTFFVEKDVQAITNDAFWQQDPDISGDKIVWSDHRFNTAGEGNPEIYMYDLVTKTEKRITIGNGAQTYPAIDGNKIVWTDGRNGADNTDIYMYDISTNTEKRITTATGSQRYPDIFGDKIVYFDYRNPGVGAEIFLYDLTTNTERQITNKSIAKIPVVYSRVRISGNKIVWLDYRDSGVDGINEIYMYDLSTNTERRITNILSDKYSPDISGDKVVWTDDRNGRPYFNVYMYDLSNNSERRLGTPIRATQLAPRISGNNVVWTDQRLGAEGIYMFDITTNTEKRITIKYGIFPSVSGDRVVWMDYRNGVSNDIYAYIPSVLDTDKDGYSDDVEKFLGTNPNKACITDLATEADHSKPGKPSLTWPADLNTIDSTSSINLNKINLLDMTSFLAPVRRLDTSPGDANYDKRWDLVPGKGALLKDINIQDMTNVSITAPPMFNGARAFNGPICK